MGQNSKIEWTDHTFNPWRGCAHRALADGSVHPGCEHCYAESMAKRFPDNLGQWGAEGTRVMAPESMWRQVLGWNRKAEAAGQRARVFCASIADVFEDWDGDILDSKGRRIWIDEKGPGPSYCYPGYPELGGGFDGDRPLRIADVRAKLFRLITATPWLDWQLLTKRPGNVVGMWPLELIPGTSGLWGQQKRRNVWLGTSVSNQRTADELVPQLLQARDLAPVLFLSAEPLLGAIDLGIGELGIKSQIPNPKSQIDWLIVGGESGQQARPMHPEWARSLRDQCQAAGVPFFFKQWGEWRPADHGGGTTSSGDISTAVRRGVARPIEGQINQYLWRVGKHAAGRLLDGREWNEFPQSREAPV